MLDGVLLVMSVGSLVMVGVMIPVVVLLAKQVASFSLVCSLGRLSLTFPLGYRLVMSVGSLVMGAVIRVVVQVASFVLFVVWVIVFSILNSKLLLFVVWVVVFPILQSKSISFVLFVVWVVSFSIS
jgi:hypothetical protein